MAQSTKNVEIMPKYNIIIWRKREIAESYTLLYIRIFENWEDRPEGLDDGQWDAADFLVDVGGIYTSPIIEKLYDPNTGLFFQSPRYVLSYII